MIEIWTPGAPLPPQQYVDERKAKFFDLVGYEPYGKPGEPGQYAFHAACSWYRFIDWESGARGGKSYAAGLEGAYRLVCLPGQRIWIIAPNYDLGEKEFRYVVEVVMEVMPRVDGRYKTLVKKWGDNAKSSGLFIEMTYGSEILVKTCENLPGLLGEEIDLGIFSEASQSPADAWKKYVTKRVSTRMGQAIVPTTPDGMNWVYDKFHVMAKSEEQQVAIGRLREPRVPYMEWWPGGRKMPPDHPRRDARNRWTQISAAYLSPHYPKEEHDRHKLEDDEDDYAEQVEGKFIQRSGLILHETKPGRNWITRDYAASHFGWQRDPLGNVRPPLHWPRLVGMDYGSSKPSATIIFAAHPKWWYLVGYWEWYHKRLTVADQCQAVKDELGPSIHQPENRYVLDKSASEQEYAKCGIYTTPSKSNSGQKNKLFSIWNSLCKQRQIYLIQDNLPNLYAEIPRFIWKPDSRSPSADEVAKPLKKKDHAIDAATYIVAEVHLEMVDRPHSEPELAQAPQWPPPMYCEQHPQNDPEQNLAQHMNDLWDLIEG